MKLDSVYIRRNYQGKLEGSIEMDGDSGAIKLTLTELQATQILAFMGEAFVNVARETANALLEDTEKLLLPPVEDALELEPDEVPSNA